MGKGAATNREGKQVSRTGKGEARMLINKLGQRSSGWEVCARIPCGICHASACITRSASLLKGVFSLCCFA